MWPVPDIAHSHLLENEKHTHTRMVEPKMNRTLSEPWRILDEFDTSAILTTILLGV
jgi:hypothetical protein